MVRHHYAGLGVGTDAAGRRIRARTFELTEFLAREIGQIELGARFPHRVALLASCHGLRELGLGQPSESVGARAEPGPTERVLRAVEGLTLVAPARDECCGFGGAFSAEFPEVSGRMGRAKLADLAATGAAFVTATDASCLLHLDGIRRREGLGPRFVHVAEILAAG
jgi:L-lactate dehydrogenase complex protein LldE